MSNLITTDYQKIFPENLKKYKNLKMIAVEFEKNFKKDIVSEIEKLAIYKNLDKQSNETLSELAYQYSIDNWQEALPHQVKLNLIKNAYWAHAKKGTKIAIVENLKKLNYPVTVQEWFEYNGKPFTFKLIANHLNSDCNWIDNLIEIVDKYKNCRSIVDTVDLEINREISKYKMGDFVSCEIEKEFIGIHKDIEKNNKIFEGIYRLMEMEVEK